MIPAAVNLPVKSPARRITMRVQRPIGTRAIFALADPDREWYDVLECGHETPSVPGWQQNWRLCQRCASTGKGG